MISSLCTSTGPASRTSPAKNSRKYIGVPPIQLCEANNSIESHVVKIQWLLVDRPTLALRSTRRTSRARALLS